MTPLLVPFSILIVLPKRVNVFKDISDFQHRYTLHIPFINTFNQLSYCVTMSCLSYCSYAYLVQNTQPCLDAGTCDCTSMNECYYLTQVFYLDNCWFLHGEGHEYQIEATIFNHAGLSTGAQLKVSWFSAYD